MRAEVLVAPPQLILLFITCQKFFQWSHVYYCKNVKLKKQISNNNKSPSKKRFCQNKKWIEKSVKVKFWKY